MVANISKEIVEVYIKINLRIMWLPFQSRGGLARVMGMQFPRRPVKNVGCLNKIVPITYKYFIISTKLDRNFCFSAANFYSQFAAASKLIIICYLIRLRVNFMKKLVQKYKVSMGNFIVVKVYKISRPLYRAHSRALYYCTWFECYIISLYDILIDASFSLNPIKRF